MNWKRLAEAQDIGEAFRQLAEYRDAATEAIVMKSLDHERKRRARIVMDHKKAEIEQARYDAAYRRARQRNATRPKNGGAADCDGGKEVIGEAVR